MDLDLNTYAGWSAAGYQVNIGEKATHYGRLSTGWVAMFGREQVELAQAINAADMQEIITREEHEAKKTAPGLPKVKVDARNGKVFVWVGANKPAIEKLRRHNYTFDRTTHRWIAKRDDPAAVVIGWRQSGYEVQTDIEVEEAVA